MLDLQTATAEQLAEYVLRAMGFERDDGGFWSDRMGRVRVAERFIVDLNLIVDAMRTGWTTQHNDLWWFAFPPLSNDSKCGVSTKNTGNERLDRLRLAALAWQKERGE